MKTIAAYVLFLILLSAFQCQRQEVVEPNAENQSITGSRSATLIGRWQLVEYYWSAGGPGTWTKAAPQKPAIIEFKAEGAFLSNDDEYLGDGGGCSGAYTAATDQEIVIKKKCSTGNIRQSELLGKILSTGELVITPTNPMCIEGCAYKYKPVK